MIQQDYFLQVNTDDDDEVNEPGTASIPQTPSLVLLYHDDTHFPSFSSPYSLSPLPFPYRLDTDAMPPTPNTLNEINMKLQEAIQRMSGLELRQIRLEQDLTRMEHSAEENEGILRTDYFKKDEVKLQLENIRLTIDILRATVTELANRTVSLETNIVSRVEKIAVDQQTMQKDSQVEMSKLLKIQTDAQNSSLIRIVGAQGALLLLVLGTILSIGIPLLLNHH